MSNLLIFLKNDGRMFFNLRYGAREQSVFKAVVVGLFAAAILLGLFFLFLDAFRFLSTLGGIGVLLIQHLFGFFFFGLGIMLVLSNIITAYAVYFRSSDVPFLMLQPVSRGTIAVHKHFESALLSSWAFFFIMIPFMAAFAWHQKLPLIFAFWTVLFSIPFVVLCSGMGVIMIIIAVRFLPRLNGWVWLGMLALLVAAFGFYGVSPGLEDKAGDASFLLTGLVPGIKFASFPLWPSWWVSEGIMALVRERWDRGALLFCVLLANLLVTGVIVEFIGDRFFYRAWERVTSAGENAAISRVCSSGLAGLLARILPPECRAIILKDIRAFLRDPVQIIQGLLFFGLLAIYFFNLRNLHYNLLNPVWRNLIAFLNLFSLSTIMCSFCSRFVFPQVSLEGHAFWIIGLSPTGMSRVLKYKFALAVSTMLLLSGTLMGVSAIMLEVKSYVLLINILVAAAVSFGLCGLALGLGAVFMDLKQTNPVAIISGFGGTFNLVLSLVYIMAAVFPFGLVCHEYIIGAISRFLFVWGLAAAGVWLAIITILTTCLPLIAGRRSLVTREY